MRLVALITACLTTVVVATPIPQSTRYQIPAPPNSVSLHGAAFQSSQQPQFTVKLDDDDSSEHRVVNLHTSLNPVAQTHSAGFVADIQGTFESQDLICPSGQLRHGNQCVVPRINRNIFVFGKDESKEQRAIDVELPLPEIDYNIIFVRSRPSKSSRPVIVPPPQKKTVVYVLEDEPDVQKDLIEVPAYPDADPEVYYVKVRPGENPQLPGGLDLETAYSQAIQPELSSIESSIELTIGAGDQVGIPLPSQPAEAAPEPSLHSASDAGFGVPLPAIGDSGAGFQSSFSGAFDASANVGVGLPALSASATATGGDARQQTFSGTAQFSADFGAKGLEIDFDDGKSELEAASAEDLIKQAVRYQLPRN